MTKLEELLVRWCNADDVYTILRGYILDVFGTVPPTELPNLTPYLDAVKAYETEVEAQIKVLVQSEGFDV